MSVTRAGLAHVVRSGPRALPSLTRFRWRLHRWRALERRGDRFALTPGRERYLVSVDDKLVGQLLYCMGEFEYDTFERAHALLRRPIRTLVDVGANVGSICIPAVARGAVERAVAIEPDPLNARLLAANTSINGVDSRVEVRDCAAGAGSDELLTLELNEGNFADHRIAPTGGGDRGWRRVQVRSHRLDDLAGELDPARDLVWMDVQGYEATALQGAPRILESRVPLVLELWPQALAEQGGLEPLLDAVRGYAAWFDLSDQAPRPRGLEGLVPLAASLLERRTHTDVLLI